MGIMVSSLLWVMIDLDHQPWYERQHLKKMPATGRAPASGPHLAGAEKWLQRPPKAPGAACRALGCRGVPSWRFMGTYKHGYKSPNMGCNYSYPTYNPTYNYP